MAKLYEWFFKSDMYILKCNIGNFEKKLQKKFAWTPKLDYLFCGSYVFTLKNAFKKWLVFGYFQILVGYFGYF